MLVSWSYTRDMLIELGGRYASGIAADSMVFVGAAAVVLAWLWITVRGVRLGRFSWLVVAAAVIAGLSYAWSLRWLGDDAFISFRYARNLLEGHGLVYNVGERVEGYTNFLWTMAVAGAGWLGFDLAQAGAVLALLCFVGAIVVTAVLARRLAGSESASFPLAAVAFAANYASASFATSGLETMFCTLTVALSLERALAGAYLASGLTGILATMARPDHALFYAALGGALVLGRASRRALLLYAAPFVAIFVPYFLWRWSYYGDFFPNTFYAKGGGSWHVQQGGRYLGLCVLALGLYGVVPLAAHEAWARRRELVGRYALLALPIYLLYLLKVGGDFMLGRFVVVLLPLVFVLAELSIRRLVGRSRLRAAAVASLAFVLVALPNRVVKPGEKLMHVADERTFYGLRSFSPVAVNSPSTDWAKSFNEIFRDPTSKPSVATGVVGIFGYETNLHLIDLFGLLDPVVAHKPIRTRSRPGHEKLSSPARIYELGTALSDMPMYPPRFEAWTKVKTSPVPLFMPRYDDDLVAQLNARGARRAKPIEPHLKRLRPSSDAEDRDCELWFLDRYYFESHPDDPLKEELRDRFGEAGGLGHERELLFDESPVAWTRADLDTFDGGSPLTWDVDPAPGFEPVTSEIRPDQRFVGGQTGAFLSTFDPRDAGGARLSMTSSVFEVVGDAITFQIGGGSSEGLRVELLHRGRTLRSAAGCQSDMMGRRVWDVRSLRGERVQLSIRDDDDDRAWGYLVVDTFEQWTRRTDATDLD